MVFTFLPRKKGARPMAGKSRDVPLAQPSKSQVWVP